MLIYRSFERAGFAWDGPTVCRITPDRWPGLSHTPQPDVSSAVGFSDILLIAVSSAQTCQPMSATVTEIFHLAQGAKWNKKSVMLSVGFVFTSCLHTNENLSELASYNCTQMASMKDTCMLGILSLFSRFIKSYNEKIKVWNFAKTKLWNMYYDVISCAHAWLNVQLASLLISLLEELRGYQLCNLHRRGVTVRSCDIIVTRCWVSKTGQAYTVGYIKRKQDFYTNTVYNILNIGLQLVNY